MKLKRAILFAALVLSTPAAAQTPGDTTWLAYRASAGLVEWQPNAMPPSNNPNTTLTVSSDQSLYLLTNNQYTVMLGSPSNGMSRGSIIGYYDRRFGVDFFRVTPTTTAFAWQYEDCDPTQNDGWISNNCPATPSYWHLATDTTPVCSIQNPDGTTSDCNSGTPAPVLVFTWTTGDGSVVVTEKYQLTSNGLLVQPGLSGTPSANPKLTNTAVILFRSVILNSFGQDIAQPTGTTETVVGVGYNNGVVYQNATWVDVNGNPFFQTVTPTMSFWGRLRGQDGIYVGVEDPGTAPKLYNIMSPNYCGPQNNCNNPGYWDYVGLFPSPPVAGTAIQPTWWMHLQPVHGDRDWALITDAYKAWAIPAKTYLTPLTARTDLPQALKDGLLWQIFDPFDYQVANDFITYAAQAHTALNGTTIGWHLYNYYGPEGFDRGNGGATYAGIQPKTPSLNICGPNYNASCGDWAGAVSQIQGNGDIVTPYMNPNDGDLCGLNSNIPCGDCGRAHCDSNGNGGLPYPSDASELAPLACGNPSSAFGSLPSYGYYIGHANAGGWLAQMDPTSAAWQAKVVTMWNNATSLGARGVYLDTYGAWPFGCWPNLGWSGNLITADEAAIAQVHPANDPVHFVTSENLNDNMQRYSDVLMDYSDQPVYTAPLHQAVYHPYKIIAGPANYFNSTDPLFNPLEWYIKMGRAWAWGNQQGITDHSGWGSSAVQQGAYMSRLYAAHRALGRFLAYGDVYSPMLQGSSGTSDTTALSRWATAPTSEMTISPTNFFYIQGLYWHSSADEYALVYTNTDPNSSHQFDAHIPATLQGLKVQDCEYDGTGCVDATSQLLNGGTEIQLTAAANDARLLKFTIGMDARVSADGHDTLTTQAFSTTTSSDLLVAFVAYDGRTNMPQTATVGGGGLSWQLVQRSNKQFGTAEIWSAQATSALTGITVTSQPGISLLPSQVTHGTLTVIAFSHAAGTGSVAQANARSGAPDVSISGVTAGSWVFAVGDDWDNYKMRTPVSGQYLVHEDDTHNTDPSLTDTYWVQATVAPSTTNGTVDIHDSFPTNDRWNYAAVEILAP
jgi:hypothetical protein